MNNCLNAFKIYTLKFILAILFVGIYSFKKIELLKG